MTTLEAKVDALMRRALAEDAAAYQTATADLKRLVNGAPVWVMEEEVGSLLQEIGVPEDLAGFRQTVTVLSLTVEDPGLLDALGRDLFPAAARMLGLEHWKSVERNVRAAIGRAWGQATPNVKVKYFGSIIGCRQEPPTTGEFLARMTRELRLRMGRSGVKVC